MKKLLVFCLVVCTVVLSFAGCSQAPAATTAPDAAAAAEEATQAPAAVEEAPQVGTIGVAFRRFDDTHITNIRNSMTDEAAVLGATMDAVDCQSSQTVENDKIDMFITKGYTAIGLILQENSSGSTIIEKAKAAGNLPLVFFNQEPFAEDLKAYDNAYYVGAIASESGKMQGTIMADYWEANMETMDKNKDGILQYAMITGDLGTVDAVQRTEFSVKELEARGIKVECVAQDTAMWDRVKGQEKMQAFISAYGDKIEGVFANNDDMALGAIEALKAAGYFTDGKFMPVIGVDATDAGKAAIADGTMLGTVLNDAKTQGKAAMDLLYLLAKGEKPDANNYAYTITDGKYIWIPYVPVSKDNLADFN
ncbi:MAG: galactose ABC transporter substrate-binding protein [Eubacteriales bacterium]|nr:galactose ABC transporter substrate-binding protein [Eubacteriales bacterium]